MYGEARREGVAEMVETDIVSTNADLALIDGEERADGELSDGVFDSSTK